MNSSKLTKVPYLRCFYCNSNEFYLVTEKNKNKTCKSVICGRCGEKVKTANKGDVYFFKNYTKNIVE